MFTEQLLPGEAANTCLGYACKFKPHETLQLALKFIQRTGIQELDAIALHRLGFVVTEMHLRPEFAANADLASLKRQIAEGFTYWYARMAQNDGKGLPRVYRRDL